MVSLLTPLGEEKTSQNLARYQNKLHPRFVCCRMPSNSKHGHHYKCGVDGCGYSGYRYQVCTHHLANHCPLGEVPFLCTECGARFSTKGKAEGHRTQHHPTQNADIFTGSLVDNNFKEIPMHKITREEHLQTKTKLNIKRPRETPPGDHEREERLRELYEGNRKKRKLSTAIITVTDDDEPEENQEAKEEVLIQDLAPSDEEDAKVLTLPENTVAGPCQVPLLVEFGVWSFVLFNDAWSQKGHSASNMTVILA